MISFFGTLIRFVRGLWYGFKDPEFKGLLFFVIILLLSGTVFYTQVEHWRFLDALYFSVTTLTTIGFGDFAPKTDIGKIFTIFYIFIGIGTLLGFINLIAHHTQQNDPLTNRFFKKNREDEKRNKPRENLS